MKGPSPLPAIRAPKVSSVSSSRPQYPSVTLGPRTQISPTRSGAHSRKLSGSTMRTSWSGAHPPDPTSRDAPSPSDAATRCSWSASASTPITFGCSGRTLPVAISVPSARP